MGAFSRRLTHTETFSHKGALQACGLRTRAQTHKTPEGPQTFGLSFYVFWPLN